MAESLDPTDTLQKAVFVVGLVGDWRKIAIALIKLSAHFMVKHRNRGTGQKFENRLLMATNPKSRASMLGTSPPGSPFAHACKPAKLTERTIRHRAM